MAIYYYNFDPLTTWSIKYQATDTGSVSALTSSFAKLVIRDLFTFSGDIKTIRVYKKNLLTDTDYTILGDFSALANELLVGGTFLNTPIGVFETSSHLDNWTSASLTGGPITSPPLIYQNNNILYNSVHLSPYSASIVPENDRRFKYYPISCSLDLLPNHEYSVTANFLCRQDSGASIATSSLGIYISGSAINHDILNDQLGKQLYFISATEQTKNFGQIETNFITDKYGLATISFVIFSGEWFISDVSIKAATDAGFNVDELTIYVPLSNLKRNELATFKVEFLNSKNEIGSDVIETTLPILLVNQPVYMEESDNLVLGKLSLASSIGKGIILGGDTGSYIKSYAYEGMLLADTVGSGGFILYSGSALPGYVGVGVELNCGLGTGSLGFRYSPNTGSYLSITASLHGTASWAWNVVSGSGYAKQTFGPSYTWSFDHNLAQKYVNFELYNLYDEIIIPQKIIAVNIDHADIYFNILTEGTAVATYGGHNWPPSERLISIGGIASQSFSNSVTWSFDHNLAYKYVILQTYDINSYQIIPSNVKLIDENSLEIYFTPAAAGTAIASIGGSSIIKQATIGLICSDEITPLTASNGIVSLYLPYDLRVMKVKASLSNTGSESCSLDIKRNDVTIFSAPLIISSSTYIGNLEPITGSLYEDDRITVDLLTTGDGLTGLKVYLLGY